MLDIKFIRENKDKLKEAIANKNIDLSLDELLDVDAERVDMSQRIEELRSERKQMNDLMQNVTEEQKSEIIEKGRLIKNQIAQLETEYEEIKSKFDLLMAKIPTIPSLDTPVGKGESDNKEVLAWGEIPKFDFEPKTHIELGKSLDILDLERVTKVAGFRGYYVKNEGVLLMMGFMMYALKKMVEKGYMSMIPPTMIRNFALFGSGYFEGKDYNSESDNIYQIGGTDEAEEGEPSKERKYLVGTAEPSLLAYYSGEVLDEGVLPLKMCGFSQCYRSEIGSYGKDTKGMYRVHEFMKVEQVVLAKADVEEATKIQEEMIGISKELHEDLGLPYRQLQICTGDMSAGKYRAFDLEAWMPGLNRWGETGSASNFLDWQARRLNVKYKSKDNKKQYVYMLNNTALASPRTFIAILENYQQKDGSVKVPEALVPFVGKKVIMPR